MDDFNLFVSTYIDLIEDVNDFMDALSCLYIVHIDKPKRVIEILQREKQKYKVMCDNPTALTIEDRQNIKHIRDYCKKHRSIYSEVNKYRLERTEEIIEEYKEIALKNRMFMLANQDVIYTEIDKLITMYKKLHEHKCKEYNISRQQNIREWQSQYYQCVCGLQIQKVNKARHEKTKSHQDFIKFINPTAILPKNTYHWHTEKYACECGKVVSNGNKSAHEHTKYHKQYCNKPIILDNDDNTENIILTIGD